MNSGRSKHRIAIVAGGAAPVAVGVVTGCSHHRERGALEHLDTRAEREHLGAGCHPDREGHRPRRGELVLAERQPHAAGRSLQVGRRRRVRALTRCAT